MKGLSVIFLLVLTIFQVVADPTYPLKAVPGQHYVVDRNGVPVLIEGDSAWYLTECLDRADVDYYLSNRWAQGYNAVLLDIAESGGDDGFADDTNIYGCHPFTNTLDGIYTNLLSWNISYFTNVDWVINRAAHYGMCVFAYPLYDNPPGFPGWYVNAMVGNPTTNLYQYGAFIGARYKNFSNLVWIGAGDYNEPNAPTNCLWNYIAAGILSEDTNHLITAQPQRTYPATYYSNFVTLNATYPACYPYIQSLANYEMSPILPSFLREPYYEGSSNDCDFPVLTDQACRQFDYWAVLSGDAGYFFGNGSIWLFQSGWQNLLFSPASTSVPFLGELMTSRKWYSFVPDVNHTVVIGGYGEYGTIDFATTAREATGKTVMAYIPQDAMTLTVDMTSISGKSANAWWYDPSNGVASLIGIYSNTGTQTFTAPGTNDWVLVLDDASQNYPPPGVTDPDAPTIYVDLTNETAAVGSTVNLGVVASGASPLNFQWLFNGTVLPGAVSNPLILTNVTPTNSGNYQVIVTNSMGAAASYVATLTVLVPNVMSIANMSSDLFQVTLTGIPGQTYMLQYTTNLSSPWQSLGNATINSSGAFRFYETGNPVSGFFRAAFP